MEGLPDVATLVEFDDPWFYKGTGVVVRVQFRPHHAVLVKIMSIEDVNNQHWVGKETWLLPGHLTAK